MPPEPPFDPRLLELHYDLLPEAEAEALRARIAAEPELAERYAAVRDMAGLFAEVARLPGPPLPLSHSQPAHGGRVSRGPASPRVARASGVSWGVTVGMWLLVAAAVGVSLTSLGSYLYHRRQLDRIAAGHLRLLVAVPNAIFPGVEAQFSITATTVAGEPLPAQIEMALFTPEGKRLLDQKESADSNGRLEMKIPGDMALPTSLPASVELRIAATHRGAREELKTTLSARPVELRTRLVTDRETYQPGDTIRYRSQTLTRFGLSVVAKALPIQFQIVDASGVEVAGSQQEASTSHGASGGTFTIPDGQKPGQYALKVESLDGAFDEQSHIFRIESDDHPSKPAKDRIAVRFFPESGELVAGIENRVYFTARNAQDEGVDLKGMLVEGKDNEVAAVVTSRPGEGTFDFVPRAGERYRLRITSPEGQTEEPLLPRTSADQRLVLTTAPSVFAADQDIEMRLRTSKVGMPLVVAATCRGMLVGLRTLVSKDEENRLTLPLEDHVGGVVRLTVFDAETSPPSAVAQRLVYRRPTRRLTISSEIQGLSSRANAKDLGGATKGDSSSTENAEPASSKPASLAKAGQRIRLGWLVTDEKGKPMQAALSVQVSVRDSQRPASTDPLAAVPGLMDRDAMGAVDLEDAYFPWSGDAAEATAIDFILATSGGSRPISKTPGATKGSPKPTENPSTLAVRQPPLVFDNLGEIRGRYEEKLEDYRARRTRAISTVVAMSLYAGFGLTLLTVLIGLFGLISGTRLWLPLASAFACAGVVAVVFVSFSQIKLAEDPGVEFATYAGDAAEKKAEKVNKVPHAGVQTEPRGKTVGEFAFRRPTATNGDAIDDAGLLYWNPLLLTDADGRASAQFDLPRTPGTVQITVEAVAEGRLGFSQTEIVAGPAVEAKKPK